MIDPHDELRAENSDHPPVPARGPTAGLYAGLVALACLVNYPGRLTADSLDQIAQSEHPQILTDWHSPTTTWLWSLLDPLLGQPAAALTIQTALIFTYPALLASRILADRRPIGAVRRIAAWAACAVLSTTLVFASGQIFKDMLLVGLVSALLACIALHRSDGRRRYLRGAVACIAFALLVRPTDFLLVFVAALLILLCGYESARPGSMAERLMVRARDRIYADFLARCRPQPAETILDVGVSDVANDGANLLERLYPHPRQITACGLGEAAQFQADWPAIRYARIAAGAPLPFADDSFDIATSNAVLEHVGGIAAQSRFVAELARVARRCFVSVPNRFFPVEHHTAIPLAHWTDASFRLACSLTGKRRWAEETELRLMSASRLAALAPAGLLCRIGYTGLRLGPWSSNLYLLLERRSASAGEGR